MKKFIEVIYGYSSLLKSFHKEQNYYMQPIQVMKDCGYECEIFALNTDCKIEDDPNFVEGTKVIYCNNIFKFYSCLFKNRKHIIYSNTLTIPTLSVGLIGKKTVFIPHNGIFGSNKFKGFIIKFFYRFFTKIRLNNDAEVNAVNKIKKGLGVKIPLVISQNFYNKNFKFSDKNIFISLGNLTKKKHPETILQALEIVKRRGYDFKLKVVGKDYVPDFFGCSYNDLVKKYGLEGNVEYLGYLKYDDFIKELTGGCCYLNASDNEGLCISVYETILMGMMCILPDIMSFNGILNQGVINYELGNIQDFADKICEFLENRDSYIKRIKENQDIILSDYNYERISKQLKDLFLSL